jgi:hypothetical protein
VWFWKRFRLPLPAKASRVAPAEEAAAAAFIRYVAAQLAARAADGPVRPRLRAFERLPADRQSAELPALYLFVERHLADAVGNRAQVHEDLRRAVEQHFPALLRHDDFAIIFAPPARQEFVLCRQLLMGVLDRVFGVLGPAGSEALRGAAAWLRAAPDASLPVPFDAALTLPEDEADWVPLFAKFARELSRHLEEKLGVQRAHAFFERSYRSLSRRYSDLGGSAVLLRLLPASLLGPGQLVVLSEGEPPDRLAAAEADTGAG